ncbi:MAG: sigma-54-dependent Fis family transcriptional regulator [Oligoflexia bacterium]|nr:sigma-54-dependent Fis family transcriptional regulator [Oligoflexia bacterium]
MLKNKNSAKFKYNETILVVDDAVNTLEVIQRNLLSTGFNTITTDNVPDAIKLIESNHIDLVITDYKMPRISGLDLARHIKENFQDIEVIMITGYATVEGAVSAIKEGVQEYLTKPFTDEELLSIVEKSVVRIRNRKKVSEGDSKNSDRFFGLIGTSTAMQSVYKSISKAANNVATVLITGESGTGKELVARAIHYSGFRSAAPFIAVNCAAIPENLFESELFGHIKGAFTGATESRAGFFQTADGGTIFLDEISELPFSTQAKLLRVLQEKEINMLGQKRPQKVNVKVIAATNKNLQTLVNQKLFRADLFYRLNVIIIDVPPLSKRENDVFTLAHAFSEKIAKELGKPIPYFNDQTLSVLKNYEWPGNVRELENLIERIIIMCDKNKIEICDFPSHMRFSLPPNGHNQENDYDFIIDDCDKTKRKSDKTLNEIEQEYIEKILKKTNGNKTLAASILKIDRKTLREKLEKYKEINKY